MSSCTRFLLVEDVNLLPVIHAGVEDLREEVRLLFRGALLALHAHDFLSRGTLATKDKKVLQAAEVALVRNSRWWVVWELSSNVCVRARVQWWKAC